MTWSRDQLSVKTKTVRFWKILLAQAERAYEKSVTWELIISKLIISKVALATGAESWIHLYEKNNSYSDVIRLQSQQNEVLRNLFYARLKMNRK